MGIQDPATDAQTKNESQRRLGGIQEEDVVGDEGLMEKYEITDNADKNAEKIWKTMAWAACGGAVPVMKVLRSILRWRTSIWWRSGSAWDMRVGPMNVSRWKHNGASTPMTRWAAEVNDLVQTHDICTRPRRMM